MKPGIYTDLDNETYHKSEGISKSGLDLFSKDQSSLEWVKNCPVDEEKMAALDFGDAVHAILLEPERLHSDFVALPQLDLRTKAGKEMKAEFEEAHKEKTIITFDERRKLNFIFESVMAHPGARRLIEAEGVAEASHYWIDPETEILCKCRPDKNIANTNILMDVKTTHDMAKFKFSIQDLRYYVQHPFYLDGVTATGDKKTLFVFLVVQTTINCGRYPVRCVVLPEEVVEFGRREYKQDLLDYLAAKERGKFDWLYQQELPLSLVKKVEGEIL